MRAGNFEYEGVDDIPQLVPVFPLSGAILLPNGDLPLNIFEPRYVEMVDAVLATDRLVGVVQPDVSHSQENSDTMPPLSRIGGLGRLTSYGEVGDGRYFVTLTGICRFEIVEEMESKRSYRIMRISVDKYINDFVADETSSQIDREYLLNLFEEYLKAKNLETDWEDVTRSDNETLINSLAMMSPYGAGEKQALLEAENLKIRAETLIALVELDLARHGSRPMPEFQ